MTKIRPQPASNDRKTVPEKGEAPKKVEPKNSENLDSDSNRDKPSLASWDHPRQLVAAREKPENQWTVMDIESPIESGLWLKNFRGFRLALAVESVGKLEVRRSAEYRLIQQVDNQQKIGFEIRQGLVLWEMQKLPSLS